MFSRDGRGTRWSRRGKLALAALAGAVIVAVPAAWAGHMFSDVPDAYPHHDDISAIALAGITTGKTCTPPGTPPTYCPEEGVTRGQMASFPRRGMGRLSFRGTSLRPVPTSEAAWDSYPIRPGLPAGALAGAAGFIKADSTITVRLTNATGCPCRIRGSLWIQDEGLMVAFLTNVTLTTVGEGRTSQ